MYGQQYFNPYQANGFVSPYVGAQQPQMPQPANNVLPPQQALQANGRASIEALRMSPNSSVLIMDTTAPIVWLCTSDSLGNVTSTPFDISPHNEAPAPSVSDFEARLAAVEENVSGIMKKWEDINDAKSNAENPKRKSDGE